MAAPCRISLPYMLLCNTDIYCYAAMTSTAMQEPITCRFISRLVHSLAAHVAHCSLFLAARIQHSRFCGVVWAACVAACGVICRRCYRLCRIVLQQHQRELCCPAAVPMGVARSMAAHVHACLRAPAAGRTITASCCFHYSSLP